MIKRAGRKGVERMTDLPMLAFRINGLDGAIELFIDEVFGFPNETSYGGGYGAKGRISITAGGYSVKSQHYFTTGELYEFSKVLTECQKEIFGKAELRNVEGELGLVFAYNRLGQVNVSGAFQERLDVNTKLTFEFRTDQTRTQETLLDLNRVAAVFGDSEGVHKHNRKK